MQPSGALGAHDLLVRPGNAWCKRKKEKNAVTGILRILSELTCGFLRRRSAWKTVSIPAAKPSLWPPPRNTQKRPACRTFKKNGPPNILGGPHKKQKEK